jgi:DNA-binding transcriptional ArsR family regulator
MNVFPGIAAIATLIGDPTRAIMMTSLMDGRALTVSELGRVAGVTVQTASGHLQRLQETGLLALEKQGRHRYYRLAGQDVAELIEGMMNVAQRAGAGAAKRVATGPGDTALRHARVCYDHLAGEQGVALLDGLLAAGHLQGGAGLNVTAQGTEFFNEFGVDVPTLARGRRPVCRTCLDWSERRNHLGGALGAALFTRFLELRWLNRRDGRALAFSPIGMRDFNRVFGP